MTPEQLKEIAGEMDIGNRCFIHKETGELIFLPDFDSFDYIDPGIFKEEIGILKKERKNYFEIPKIRSFESYRIMSDFIGTVKDFHFSQKLERAIQRPKPFRHFNDMLLSQPEVRQKWFAFKEAALMRYVEDQVKALGEEEE